MNPNDITILPIDVNAAAAARTQIDALSKPIGSLGMLEDIAVRMAGITGQTLNAIKQPEVIVMAADNGIWDEGITLVPQSVTSLQATLIAQGRAGVTVIAGQYGINVSIVDVGIKGMARGLVNRRVMDGTHNMALGPAMTRDECLKAVDVGFVYALERINAGVDALGVGEMGICNTSTAAAVLTVLTGADINDTVGLGAGISPEGLNKKRDTVRRALEVNHPDPGDVVGVLAKVGGLDIAAMTGVYLAAAHMRIPAVIDGFISMTAALCAARLQPRCAAYMFASHKSAEQGYVLAARALGLAPVMDLGMRLGEGSGAPIMLSVIRTACALPREMASLDEVMLNAGDLVDIRQ